MDISFHGANCIEIATKKATIITDGGLARVGLKDVAVKEGIYVNTHHDFVPQQDGGIVVDGPGEYEIQDISVRGVPAVRTTDHDGAKWATMYRIVIGEISIAVIGHVSTPLTDEQLEALGVIDIAIIPVGGNGYTLDAHQAVAAVRQLDPKVVIPTHYADKGVKYEVEQMELAPFLQELSANHVVESKYKLKGAVLPDALTVVEITRS